MISNLDSLRDIFISDGYPYWKLYEGHSIGRSGSIGENMNTNEDRPAVDDIEESWVVLEDRLEAHSGGRYTLLVFTNPSAGNKNTAAKHTHKLSLPKNSAVAAPNGQNSFMANFMQMFEMQQFFQQQAMANTDAVIAGMRDEIAKDREIEKLREEIKQLKAPTAQGKIIDKLLSKSDLLIDKFLPKKMNAHQMAGQIAGTTEEVQEVEEVGEVEDGNIDLNHMVGAHMAIQQITGVHPNQLLSDILAFGQNNPDGLVQALNYLK